MRYRYVYKYKTGLTRVKTKLAIAFTGLGLGVGGIVGSIAIFGAAHAATTTVVTPSSLNGWSIHNFDSITNTDLNAATTPSGTHGEFVNGPAIPPVGSGSFHQVVGTAANPASGDDAQRLWTSAYNGVSLSSLTGLSYSTYVTSFGSGGQATYIQLRIDRDGDGTTDDILFFEPVYQNGTYGMLSYSSTSVPNQCGINPNCVSLNTWQTWDAQNGGWWSNLDSAGGPPLTTLANYATKYPNAKLATDTAAVRLTAGFGGAAWAGFDGNVDNFSINGTNFDFELTPPAVTLTSKEQCKNGGWQTSTTQSFKNQGDCVSYFATGGKNPPNGPAKH